MKKKLCMITTTIMVLFINGCTLQNKEAHYINENHNRQSVPQTHLYNSQVPVKNHRQILTVPTSTGVHPDKYQMIYQNLNPGTESTWPR